MMIWSVLLAIWLLLTGLTQILPLPIPVWVLGVLAIVTAILLLVGR